MKLNAIFALLFFAIIAGLMVNHSEAHNVTWGTLGTFSRLLESKQIRQYSSLFRVKDEIVEFPAKNVLNFYNITAIRVIDHKEKNGGLAYLINGGPYYPYAKISLVSERGHGLHYTIQYYVY